MTQAARFVIPQDLLDSSRLSLEDLKRELALTLYAQGRLSLGNAPKRPRPMPEISRFFGITIFMNWREHPPLHFHALYGEHEALITLDGKVYAGGAPWPGSFNGA